MATRQTNITVPSDLYKVILQHATTHSQNFSQAISNLAETGIKFVSYFGNTNVELVQERISTLSASTESLKQEISFLRHILMDRIKSEKKGEK